MWSGEKKLSTTIRRFPFSRSLMCIQCRRLRSTVSANTVQTEQQENPPGHLQRCYPMRTLRLHSESNHLWQECNCKDCCTSWWATGVFGARWQPTFYYYYYYYYYYCNTNYRNIQYNTLHYLPYSHYLQPSTILRFLSLLHTQNEHTLNERKMKRKEKERKKTKKKGKKLLTTFVL